MKRIKVIRVGRNGVGELCKMYHVSKATIYNALNYTTWSDLAMRIRATALELGGVSTTKVVLQGVDKGAASERGMDSREEERR